MVNPAVAAAGLRRVGRWTWALIVLGGPSYELDGGRLSPGSVVALGGLAVALWRLSKVDERAKAALFTAAMASGVASVCAIGPIFGRPVGPALATVFGIAAAVGLWTALAGFVLLARQLPAIRLQLRRIRRALGLLFATGAVLLAGHKGWELGGARPVANLLQLTWTAAEVVTVLLLVAVQFWIFRVFMALRAAAEMLLERGPSLSSGTATDALDPDRSEPIG